MVDGHFTVGEEGQRDRARETDFAANSQMYQKKKASRGLQGASSLLMHLVLHGYLLSSTSHYPLSVQGKYSCKSTNYMAH